MNPKTIKIIIAIAVLTLLAAGGTILYFNFKGDTGSNNIEFNKEYYLTEIHPKIFDGVSINSNSYLKIYDDKLTGEIYLVGLAQSKLDFIVTKYDVGLTETKFNIEYIYRNELYQITAISTGTKITFKTSQTYRVDVTQENPEDIYKISYDSTIMVFEKEVA